MFGCFCSAALSLSDPQDLSRAYLAHHEVESEFTIYIIHCQGKRLYMPYGNASCMKSTLTGSLAWRAVVCVCVCESHCCWCRSLIRPWLEVVPRTSTSSTPVILFESGIAHASVLHHVATVITFLRISTLHAKAENL